MEVDASALRDCLERSPIVPKPVHSFGIKLMVSCHPNNTSLHTMEDLVLKISHEKFNCELDTRLIPLNEIRGWKRTADELFHEKRLFFSLLSILLSLVPWLKENIYLDIALRFLY